MNVFEMGIQNVYWIWFAKWTTLRFKCSKVKRKSETDRDPLCFTASCVHVILTVFTSRFSCYCLASSALIYCHYIVLVYSISTFGSRQAGAEEECDDQPAIMRWEIIVGIKPCLLPALVRHWFIIGDENILLWLGI